MQEIAPSEIQRKGLPKEKGTSRRDTADRRGIVALPRYERQAEHSADAILLLERLRQAARDGVYPSTAELQAESKYGLRPVNRLVDLRKGKYNRTRYDIERLDCGHGVCRWRLYEPNRPDYPKDRNQNVLPLDKRPPAPVAPEMKETIARVERDDFYEPADWYERATGKPRPKFAQEDLFLWERAR